MLVEGVEHPGVKLVNLAGLDQFDFARSLEYVYRLDVVLVLDLEIDLGAPGRFGYGESEVILGQRQPDADEAIGLDVTFCAPETLGGMVYHVFFPPLSVK